jgi:transcription-repair coupling factor (superfamily II helicase)
MSDHFPILSQLCALPADADTVIENARGAAAAKLLAELHQAHANPLLALVPDPEMLDDLAGDLELFGAGDYCKFPAWDILPHETDHPDLDTAASHIATLRAFSQSKNPLIIAPVTALLQPSLPPEALETGHLEVSTGLEISPEGLCARLRDAGLEHVEQVEAPGQFSRRGGIVDAFPLFADQPLRMEFFGDEIDTLRFFDPLTQRGSEAFTEPVMLIDVGREVFRKLYERRAKHSVLDFIPPETRLAFIHPARIETMSELYRSGFDKSSPLLDWREVCEKMNRHRFVVFPEIRGEEWPENTWRALKNISLFDLRTQTVERLSGGRENSLAELQRLVDTGVETRVFCNNQAEQQRLSEILLESGGGVAKKVSLQLGHLSRGFMFELPDRLMALIGDHEIFGRYTLKRTKRKSYSGAPIADFTRLKIGDYVVHILNGIARYEGMTALESNGTKQDYLTLKFAEDAKLYVPLSHVDLVQRYVGAKDGRPVLTKLDSGSWHRRRRAAEKAVRDIAADLLRLQAVRKTLPGLPFAPDDELQREFDESFPYEETPDQLAAIADLKADQESPSPMDRLLCGDVGFGKTEVAIRAAFKVVNNGKQVAVLVPTTILAEQHHRTFSDRMADYPVTVACLSRFRTPMEQKRIVEAAREGRVDIVIGTHRLLSKDVSFRDLGLVVIDEEQRFGVEHKERLKELRASVDVLTMTATPIPRTLHMSLLGLRDISNLATAPVERQNIKTIVVRTSDELIRRGILRELSRNGQCFFLHNRVHNIDSIAGHLCSIVPEARFAIAHGQMPENELLQVMTKFLDHKIDVLVCTTIVESGVDIPNVNTLFVNNADHFGLSELHQLRGRVGRYKHQAYAYFLVPAQRPVSPVAQKRLNALEEYSELGAGFRLAMRDLEIRGAGNILGIEQSGHISLIGFELYCRLLEKTVAEFRGETLEESDPVELDLGTKAYIPSDYIESDTQRIDFYRRLSGCRDEPAIENLRGYTRDRYGEIRPELERCFQDQQLRVKAHAAGINFLGRIDSAAVVGFSPGQANDGVSRLRLLSRKVTPLGKGRWRLELSPGELSPENLLEVMESILDELGKPLSEIGASVKKAFKSDKPFGSGPSLKKAAPVLNNRQEAVSFSKADRLEQSLAENSSKKETAAPVPATSPNDGIEVSRLEAGSAPNILNAAVKDFSLLKFGPVTLVPGEGERFFLRYTGTARLAGGDTALTLLASSPEEAQRVLLKHRAGQTARLFSGIVEDEP